MHFRKFKGVATALIVFATASLQFCLIPASEAHGIAVPLHNIKMPIKVKATPVNNVRDFGATGNGVTDDTNAIQNAANNAAARHIGVFFPAGTYLHASTITFNGVPVSGVGNGSVLLANDPNNCAIFLSGYGVSIQNIVISTQGLTGGGGLTFQGANLTVYNATSFTVSNVTIVTGSGFCGLLTGLSTVGTITSVVVDGTGNTNDYGIFLAQGAANITVSNCLLQNEATGIEVGGLALFIALINNTIGSVTYPTQLTGMAILLVETCDVAGNTIQMADDRPNSTAITVSQSNNFTVANNNTYGAAIGISVQQPGTGNNIVLQNAIHNCGVQGIESVNQLPCTIQIVGNLFGECGLTASGVSTNNAVILITGSGADMSAYTTYVANNSYQGHANGLVSYVTCTFTSPHIPATNVVGNTQSQTTLANHI